VVPRRRRLRVAVVAVATLLRIHPPINPVRVVVAVAAVDPLECRSSQPVAAEVVVAEAEEGAAEVVVAGLAAASNKVRCLSLEPTSSGSSPATRR